MPKQAQVAGASVRRHSGPSRRAREGASTPLLFSYRKLQQEGLKRSTFGRPLNGEAAALVGAADPPAAAAALRAHGPAVAIVTLGAAGCVWADAAGVHAAPAPAVRAIDSTGCGDTFCGVLAAGLAGGAEPTNAIAVAQRAAALAATRRGAFAAIPSAAEIAALL